MWLLYVSCAWVAGILIGSRLDVPLLALCAGCAPFLCIPFLPGRRKLLLLLGLCIFALVGGGLRFHSSLPVFDERFLGAHNGGETVEFQGMVQEQPESRARYSLLVVSADSLVAAGETWDVVGKALLRLPRYPTYRYGDVLRITGRLETPAEYDGFDYGAYLARRGIYSVVYYPRVELLARGQGSRPLQWLYSLRERLSASLGRALVEPHGSLAQAVLLGMRGRVPDSVSEAFSRTGTAHLLAISGLHMSIVIALFLSLGLAVLGRQRFLYVWVAFGAVWLYAMLAGMNPPVLRAAIMGSIFLLAIYLGRQRSAVTALAFAAAVMVGVRPQLLWMVSFQLSFAAMAGLVLLYPRLRAWGRSGIARLPGVRGAAVAAGEVVTDGVAATLAALVLAAPLLAHYFGTVSPVALPATFFCLPVLPAVVVTSALVAFSGLILPAVAQALGWLAWVFLSYLLVVVEGFNRLPFPSPELGGAAVWQTAGYYAGLAVVLIGVNRRRQVSAALSRFRSELTKVADRLRGSRWALQPKWLILPLLLAAILLWSAVAAAPDGRLHVAFLDVGQGDAILVETPAGQTILVDGGPDPEKLCLGLGERLAFWDRRIDLMVLTQPHADHVTGLIEVLERYDVGRVLAPPVSYGSLAYQEWLRLVEEKGIEYETARAGQRVPLGVGVEMRVLNPPSTLLSGTSDDIDNNGVVVRLSLGEVSFLLTADVREEAEMALVLGRADLRSTVFKAAHHGSDTSTCRAFLAAVDPAAAVISVGTDNRFGHPAGEVVARLSEQVGEERVYRTDRDGPVEFVTDGRKLWVMPADSVSSD